MYLWKGIALIEDDTHFTKWVKQVGRLDHHQGYLKTLKPYIHGMVLDIGANIGTHTHYYLNYATTVLAFEPNPLAFECLAHNCPKATLVNAAVGAGPGHIDMLPTGKNYGAWMTQPGNTIPVISIDSLELPACNFIKMDVEGDELSALRGAEKTITKYKPVMAIECNSHTLQAKGWTPADLCEYIQSLGYNHNPYTNECVDLLCVPK